MKENFTYLFQVNIFRLQVPKIVELITTAIGETLLSQSHYCLGACSCQMKCIIYQTNINCDVTGYKQKCFLAHLKQHLKIVLGIAKRRSTTLNIKMIRNYQNSFGKSKSAMEHQNLSEYVVLTIQTVSAAFYV